MVVSVLRNSTNHTCDIVRLFSFADTVLIDQTIEHSVRQRIEEKVRTLNRSQLSTLSQFDSQISSQNENVAMHSTKMLIGKQYKMHNTLKIISYLKVHNAVLHRSIANFWIRM